MLSHSDPLGLAHRLPNIKLLLLSCVSTEDRELMQLKTVQEEHPRLRTPTFGNFTVYCSPRVVLVHLVADAIPLRLCVTRQQIPQLLIGLGDCLVVSILGLLEHLGSLLNLHLASRNVSAETVSRDSMASRRFFNAACHFATALGYTRHFFGSPF